MAKTQGVWGIDLGQNALKAMRCLPHEEDPKRVVADAFDFIEYPKILSASDPDSAELIQDAIKQFLARNSVKGDKVVISVPGQAGLARFIKLPPVESKKIPALVQFEAKQQIPFPLDEVIWDFQQLSGGAEEEGFALETEVGIFAIKRDQVYRSLAPFQKAAIEVDIVQLAPLSLYNFVAFDQMLNLPPPDEFDPEEPPESVVLLSMGCDTTDLVVTNGYRVWQRSIPIGGSHFTKALVKDFDLSFSKAEHLKRNATSAQDPKAVFQAMRPIFNDLVTECQRSLNFFQNLDRNAKIGKILGLGNVMKLPGIRTYLSQNLGYEVERLDKFEMLSGPAVTESKTFKDNIMSFPVCYGLALQGMRDIRIRTNLIPREILQDRMIRAKKPWAVAAAAALLMGMSVSAVWEYWRPWNTVHESHYTSAESESRSASQEADTLKASFEQAVTEFQGTDELGKHLVENVTQRELWLEMLRSINLCLPPYPELMNEKPKEDWSESERITNRHQINVTAVESQWVDNLGNWWTLVSALPHMREAAKATAPPADPNNPTDPSATPAPAGPSGAGWVVRLTGHHYHNPNNLDDQGAAYIKKTVLAHLAMNKVEFVEGNTLKTYPVGELGIKFPVIIRDTGLQPFDPLNQPEPNPFGTTGGNSGMGREGGISPPMFNPPSMPTFRPPNEGGGNPLIPGGGLQPNIKPPSGEPEKLPLMRTDFQIEFCWTPTPVKDRLKPAAPVAPTDPANPGMVIDGVVAPPSASFSPPHSPATASLTLPVAPPANIQQAFQGGN